MKMKLMNSKKLFRKNFQRILLIILNLKKKKSNNNRMNQFNKTNKLSKIKLKSIIKLF